MAKLEKNDFIELEYIGKVKDGEIFDTNIKEEAKKIELDIKTRPLIICLGQGMILPSIDEFLIGKEEGKEYTLDLTPEKAFGHRHKEMIRVMTLNAFKKQDIYPQVGMVFAFDNALGRISSVSGGRVIVDFNNPIAGKEVVYNLKIKKKIEDDKEKVKVLMQNYFRHEFEFKIEDKKLIIEADPRVKQVLEIFKDKFKELIGLDLEIKEVKIKEKEHVHDENCEHEHAHEHSHDKK